MGFAELPGQIVGSLGDPLLWAAMVLAALRVPQRLMLPAAIAVAFAMQAIFRMIDGVDVFPLDSAAFVGGALVAWLAGTIIRFFVDRSRRAPVIAVASRPAA